jgi:hypothetical protein
MKTVLSSLRHLILGETWTIPIGVGAALLLAVPLRASLVQRRMGGRRWIRPGRPGDRRACPLAPGKPMTSLRWGLIALGAVLLTYAGLVALLVAVGRKAEARALARFVPDCLVLFRRLLSDPRISRRRKLVLLALVAYSPCRSTSSPISSRSQANSTTPSSPGSCCAPFSAPPART